MTQHVNGPALERAACASSLNVDAADALASFISGVYSGAENSVSEVEEEENEEENAEEEGGVLVVDAIPVFRENGLRKLNRDARPSHDDRALLV